MALSFFGGKQGKTSDLQSPPEARPSAPQEPHVEHALAPLDKPFEICRPGTFVDASGMQIELTEAGLREVATGYNIKLRRAPLVLGHPKMDDPAFGWVKTLDYRDGALVAIAEQVDVNFASAVRDGRYNNRSASFYLRESPNNPTPGRPYLKHIGFLGARQPAVDGLKPLEFSALEGDDAHDLVVSMAGWEAAYRQRLRQEIEEERSVDMAAFEQQVVKRVNLQREVAQFCEDMVQRAIVPPGHREAFLALAESVVREDNVVQFGEGEDQERVNAWDLFRRMFEWRPPMVEKGEFKPQGGPLREVTLAMPDGVAVDTSRSQIHAAATAYQQKHNCSYRDAVRAVTGGGR